jgi:uracil-DNA glycosylase family 4
MIKGFFTDEEIRKGTQTVVNLDEMGPNCQRCGLHRKVKSPMMKYSGDGEKSCLIIGEAPGGNEDEVGTQFEKHAVAGGYLRKVMNKWGLDLDRHFWKTNGLCCRPVKVSKGVTSNRSPTPEEIRYCHPLLIQTVKELRPKFIWLLGGVAVDSFYLDLFGRKPISRFRGISAPDQRWGAWVVPMFHPSFITRDVKNANLTSQFDRDMEFANSVFANPFVEVRDYEPRVDSITNFDDLVNVLDNILSMKPEILEIDYETTGIKPFMQGHKILSISMCCDKNHAISFPYQYQDFWDRSQFVQIKSRMRKILLDQEIHKMAHNAKFEYIWTHELMGIKDPGPWDWDSLIAAHILDNRRGWSGLKFQTYVNFGVYPYDGTVKRFIKGYPFNKLEKAPLEDLLQYGGYDSLFGFMLAEKQKDQFQERGQKLLDAYDLFHRGTFAMARLEMRGICVDEEYFETQSNEQDTGEIDRKIDDLLKVTKFGKEARDFEEKEHKELDIQNPRDLSILIYDIMGKPKILTDKGNPSVDEKALQRINIPFTQNLLRIRKLAKLKTTYMPQFKRFAFDGKIHPSFDLTVPVTYRSSSSDPSFHNIPKRDEFSKKACRRGIKPRKGRGLLSSDFSGVEVAISACYNKDKNLIKYVTDEKTDMHRDSAADIWTLPQEEVSGKITYSGKNGWVFPQFYNSYYVSCAKDLWDNYLDLETNSGVKLKDHMAKKGIKNLDAFTAHCKKVEDKFWGVRFKTYKKWKEEINKLYQKQGFLETYFGFQFTGYMGRNECCNYQTQGTAFHCLLWTLLEVEAVALRDNWSSMLVGQIHDDMVHDYDEPELDTIIETVDYYGTQEIRDRHKWIIIPLKIDHEISGIDGNWADMEEIK